MSDAETRSTQTLPVLDVPGGLKRCGDDRTLFFLLLNELPSQIEEEMAGIRTDLANGKRAEAARRAHSLRGSCVNLGAVRLAGALMAVEIALKSAAATGDRALLPELESAVAETSRLCREMVS